VSLLGGAQACNVFWQVGSSATLGTTSTFIGNILALTSIQVQTGVTVDGRVLASNASVTLDDDVITRGTCVASTTPPPTTPPATTPPPSGGVPTGGGSMAGFQEMGLLVIGGSLLAIALGAFAVRRRAMRNGSSS
jgi:hypothetical protein